MTAHGLLLTESCQSCLIVTLRFLHLLKGETFPINSYKLQYIGINDADKLYGWLFLGELHLEDEKGNTAKLFPGDTFFIHRGSSIVFSTPRYAVAYKVGARSKMH
ncbi:Ethanolamine utilization EutQ [Penicillium concentricum]|uniref:Ethanolamine utilization EutQ n=1 Tax=Penicillium concentricum TaxID=293559 RepID=A0A9W9SD31_9EURO|nr:Ethanolamine utilization EutQ [Penicillium concentricum]KAJ5373918.1 Ethanolamine utilization EutQ [Penicillium concentricum]